MRSIGLRECGGAHLQLEFGKCALLDFFDASPIERVCIVIEIQKNGSSLYRTFSESSLERNCK